MNDTVNTTHPGPAHRDTADPAPAPAPAGGAQADMQRLLAAAFAPSRLDVRNDSAAHRGHMGDDGSGETHFTVIIESAAFTGVTRLERQRMVNRALGDIPGGRVHALAIRATAPGEPA